MPLDNLLSFTVDMFWDYVLPARDFFFILKPIPFLKKNNVNTNNIISFGFLRDENQ